MLKIVEFQSKTDKNGRKGVQISFVEEKSINGRPVYSNKKPCKRILWDKTENVQADPLYSLYNAGNIKIGDLVEGEIRTVRTTKYEISGREVNQYTGVLFEGENIYKTFNSNLKENSAVCIDDDGVLTAEIPILTKEPND